MTAVVAWASPIVQASQAHSRTFEHGWAWLRRARDGVRMNGDEACISI